MPTNPAPIECDARCPAAALVIVTRGRSALAFCGHHFADNEVLLELNGWRTTVDDRPSLRNAA